MLVSQSLYLTSTFQNGTDLVLSGNSKPEHERLLGTGGKDYHSDVNSISAQKRSQPYDTYYAHIVYARTWSFLVMP
jgi:hypothetical protein